MWTDTGFLARTKKQVLCLLALLIAFYLSMLPGKASVAERDYANKVTALMNPFARRETESAFF